MPVCAPRRGGERAEKKKRADQMATAYAADGYARIKGISALITTFGVGTMHSHAP